MKAEYSIGNNCTRVGNYTVGPNDPGPNDLGWGVFDWTRDEDISWHATEAAAIRKARRLMGSK